MQKIFSLSNVTLVVALALSTVAAYYSIIGLTAIFAGAVIPVIIMGSILEIGKITTTVWLRKYWNKASWILKLYLVPAVVALAILTSMGIFGFLSKAHMDTGVTSGDVQAKLALYDEKIKTQRDNVELARKALQQMDAQVDARLSRGESEAGAERAVQIRRQQAGERAKLQKEIGDAQKEIARLNEERAPIAAENRKVEAEVGPIKYVAALIYGDNPDANLLERAVRWVIILLVIVFDPLAIALVLAANASREWDQAEDDDKAAMNIHPEPEGVTVRQFTEEELQALDGKQNKAAEAYAPWPTDWTDADSDKLAEETLKDIEKEEKQEEKVDNIATHPYLSQGFKYPEGWEFHPPLVYTPEVKDEVKKEVAEPQPLVEQNTINQVTEPVVIVTDNTTKESPIKILQDGDYVLLEGKHMRKEAAQAMRPDLFKISADTNSNISTAFGTVFPKFANKGDIYVRVDVLPNRVFKFDGKRWIEVNKEHTQSYLHNDDYLQFLVSKLENGEYDLDMLSDKEKEQIESYLNSSK